MKLSRRTYAFKLIELMFTTVLIGVLGLIIYSLLTTGMVLGAKNTAVNTAHQQARVAMLEMFQDLHSAVSLPQLVDTDGVTPWPTPGVSPSPAPGIAFQEFSMGPFKIIHNTAALPTSQNSVRIALPTSTTPWPVVNQRLIIPTYQIEGDITAVSGSYNDLTVTLANINGPAPSPAPSPVGAALPVQILGTDSTVGDVVCYVTERCAYTVASNALKWNWRPQSNGTFQFSRVMGNDITNSAGVIYDPNQPVSVTNVPPTPFSIPTTPAGALYYRSVAAINLSTSDINYSKRGYKSANILLNGQVPYKARLTTYQ